MRRLGKSTVSVVLFTLVLAWASTAFANDGSADSEGQNQSEAEQRVTAQRGPPKPVPVFSGTTVTYQLVAGTSMMVGAGAAGAALLGAGHVGGESATGVVAVPGVLMLVMAPPIGAMIGSTWVGHRRYDRGRDNLRWTAKGTGLGWIAGLSVMSLMLDDDEAIEGDTIGAFFATTAVGSLVGSILGYHLGQMRANHRAETDIRRWSTIEVTPLGMDGGTEGVGVMLRTSGRF